MKILLVGNYGADNVGDDLLMNAAMAGLEANFSGPDVRVMGPGRDLHYPLPSAGVRSYLRMNTMKANKGFEWCDIVVLGGGGLFNTEVPKSLNIWGKVIKGANKFDKKIYMIGQSFSGVNLHLEKMLNQVDLICVRDSHSYKLLQRSGLNAPVRLVSDLVFGLPDDSFVKDELVFDDEYIAVNLREYVSVELSAVESIIDELVDKVTSSTPYSMYFVPFGPGDHKFMKTIVEKYKDNGRVLVLESLDDSLEALTKAVAVVSMRLHPCLVGLATSKPVLNLSYMQKTSSFMSDNDVVSIDLTQVDDNASEVLSAFIHSLGSDAEYDLDGLKSSALDNYKHLKVMIGKN
jgi:polysaccharide pyruvyl transferase WcaK-like protein